MDARNKFSSIYDAHPLDAGPSTNIRVIKVLRNASTDTDVPIACELQVVSLEYSPVYTCLSYVWGQDAASKEILLDGKPFKIRENLWNLLMQYRSTTSSDDCIWVDALSIDQGRVGERNHQVALMKRIYSEARMVISWLGSGPNSPARALQELAEPWDNNWLSYLTNLVTLCQSEYWDRLWIIQEFVLARALEIWSGAARVQAEAFAQMLLTSNKLPRTAPAYHATDMECGLIKLMRVCRGARAKSLVHRRREHHHPRDYQTSSYDFVHLFFSFRSVKCSDPRDRVYGLLGLLDPKLLAAFPLQPDYSKSMAMVFADLWTWRYDQDVSDTTDYALLDTFWTEMRFNRLQLVPLLHVSESEYHVLDIDARIEQGQRHVERLRKEAGIPCKPPPPQPPPPQKERLPRQSFEKVSDSATPQDKGVCVVFKENMQDILTEIKVFIENEVSLRMILREWALCEAKCMERRPFELFFALGNEGELWSASDAGMVEVIEMFREQAVRCFVRSERCRSSKSAQERRAEFLRQQRQRRARDSVESG